MDNHLVTRSELAASWKKTAPIGVGTLICAVTLLAITPRIPGCLMEMGHGGLLGPAFASRRLAFVLGRHLNCNTV